MTLSEFLKREREALNKKTLYVLGGWGQPLTDKNKKMFTSWSGWAYNQKADRKAKIFAADKDTIAVDCVCAQKSIIDGLFGVDNQTSAMRTPCPDITIQAILNKCSNVRDISYNKEPDPGDFLTYADFSHCGVYLGNNEVCEATYTGTDGLQIRAYKGRGWKWAGRLPWIEYDDAPSTITKLPAVQVMANKTLKTAKKYLKEGQTIVHVGEWYKNAYIYKSKAEAQKNLASVRKTYKDAFITEYDEKDIVMKGE